MSTVAIEFQDVSGNWVRVQRNVQNQGQVIKMRMNEVKRSHPKSKVRAVDEKTGSVVDMLM